MQNLITLLIVLGSYTCTFSQMIPATGTMRTPYGNSTYTYYVPSPNHYYYNYSGSSNVNISLKYRFKIVLQNDSSFEARTKIDLEGKKNSMEVKKPNKELVRVKPKDTKSISRVTNGGKMLVGIAADSCWLFKIVLGKLDLYSFLAEEDPKFAIAFQQGTGPILPLNKETLEPFMKDDEKLMELINDDKFVKAVMRYNKK